MQRISPDNLALADLVPIHELGLHVAVRIQFAGVDQVRELPSPLRSLITSFRNSRGHRVSLLIGLVVAFLVAWRTWISDIFGSLGESGWLFDLVLYMGAFIWLVLAVQLFVAFVSRRSTIR